ncbi:MAG: DNA pilot protein [Microvirus sp.]|nr:MAG: DNA pilot protein [Microvirus sp.]
MSMPSFNFVGPSSAIATKWQNDVQHQATEDQERFQERMSSTAHQREVKDLHDAGLNPVLSATLGGSSTPMGSMPQMPTPQMGVRIDPTSAAQLRLINEQAKLTKQQALHEAADTILKNDYLYNQGSARALNRAQTRLLDNQADVGEMRYHGELSLGKNYQKLRGLSDLGPEQRAGYMLKNMFSGDQQ